MSGTYRRRHDKWAMFATVRHYTEFWEAEDQTPRWQWSLYRQRLRLDINASEQDVRRSARAYFYRDVENGRLWMGNAPAWFRRMLNAQFRTRQKAALHAAIADGADDVTPVRAKVANWEWW
jgi:hypothetical protein